VLNWALRLAWNDDQWMNYRVASCGGMAKDLQRVE